VQGHRSSSGSASHNEHGSRIRTGCCLDSRFARAINRPRGNSSRRRRPAATLWSVEAIASSYTPPRRRAALSITRCFR